MLSENWYREHTAPFKAALEDDTLYDLPQDADILADLRAFEVVRGVPRIPDKRTTGKSGTQRHGDAGIAYLLLYYAYRTDDGFDIDFQSTGDRAISSLFETDRPLTGRGFGSIGSSNDFRGYV